MDLCMQAHVAGVALSQIRQVHVPSQERELCDYCAGPIANMRRECCAPACRVALCLTCCQQLHQVPPGQRVTDRGVFLHLFCHISLT